MGDFEEISPPLLSDLGLAPPAVCSRWMGASPCGAAATWHVIWTCAVDNGAICDAHAEEARRRWVFVGMHRYGPACVPSRGGLYFAAEDICRMTTEGT